MAALSSIWASVDWYHLALEVELLVRPRLVLGNVFVVDVPTGLKRALQLSVLGARHLLASRSFSHCNRRQHSEGPLDALFQAPRYPRAGSHLAL